VDETRSDGLDLPAEAFTEHRAESRRRPVFFWPLIALLTLVAVIIAFVFR